MIRMLRIAAVLAALLLLSLGWAGSVAAQEAGDQIVDPEGTPAANASSDDGNFNAAQETDDSTDDQDGDQQDADTAEEPDAESDASTSDNNQSDDESQDDDSGSDGGSAAGDELIAVEDLNLREEASVDSDVIAVIPAGSSVTVSGDGTAENDFVPISFEGDDGWGYVPYLVTPELGDNLAVVTTELNLRAGPSVDDEVLAVMPTGAEVRVAGIETDADGDDWNHVLYEDGTFAWALAAYVEFTNAATTDESTDTADTAESPDSGEATPAEDTSEAAAAPAVSGELATTIDVNLRAGPTLDDEVLLVLPAGTVVSADGEAENGFVPVTAQGMSGWVSTDFIAPAEEILGPVEGAVASVEDAAAATDAGTTDTTVAADAQSRTTLSDLSLRAGPSADSELLLIIPAGDVVTLTPDGAENGYVTVDYQGVAGWTLAEYLQ